MGGWGGGNVPMPQSHDLSPTFPPSIVQHLRPARVSSPFRNANLSASSSVPLGQCQLTPPPFLPSFGVPNLDSVNCLFTFVRSSDSLVNQAAVVLINTYNFTSAPECNPINDLAFTLALINYSQVIKIPPWAQTRH